MRSAEIRSATRFLERSNLPMPAGSPDKVKWGSEVTSKSCRVRRQNFGFVAGTVCRRLTRKEGPPYNENSFVSQLRLFDLASNSMPQTRPDHLEEFIRSLVCECRGVYAPDFDRVKRSVGYAEEDLRRYLGTYYPRSLLETYDIASELFRKIFGTEVRTDGELKILDLGCGLGGALAGLLFAVLERFGVRKVSVDGFDANEASLRTFERILASESFALARAELRRLEAPGAQAEEACPDRFGAFRSPRGRVEVRRDPDLEDVERASRREEILPVPRNLSSASRAKRSLLRDRRERSEGGALHLSASFRRNPCLSRSARRVRMSVAAGLPRLRKARVALRRIQSVRLPREQFRPLESSRGARRLQSLLPRLLPLASLPSLPSETHPF